MPAITATLTESESETDLSWSSTALLGLVFGITYLLAAEAGIWFMRSGENVAALWPAAGISSGTLLVFGRRAKVPVGIGVAVATLLANLYAEQSLSRSLIFSFCNSAECLLFAAIVERHCPRGFHLDGIGSVSIFLGAAIAATSAIGFVAALGLGFPTHSAAQLWNIWVTWLIADTVGILVIAPLMITCADAWRMSPKATPLAGGLGALVLTTFASLYVCDLLPAQRPYWVSHTPFALLLPLLLWLALRNGAVYAAAGSLIMSLSIAASFSYGYEPFGHATWADMTVADHSFLAALDILTISISTLILIALQAERSKSYASSLRKSREGVVRVEESLHESEERLRLALSAAQAAAWQWNIRTNEQVWSPESFLLHGRDPRLGQPKYEDWLACLHPDDRAPTVSATREAVEMRTPEYRTEYRVVWPSGEVHWLAALGKVEHAADGNPLRMFGINLDITARKQAEESLHESEQRMRLFIDHAPAALAMFDRDMRYVSVSRRWLSDYGLDGRDLRGLSHYEVFPEIPERWKEIHRRALSGEVVRSEEDPFLRASGHVQWLRWEVRPWHDAAGQIAGIVVFSEDISERRQAEEELAENEVHLTLALESAGAAEWSWDIVVNKQVWSDRFRALYGFSHQEPADYTLWLSRVHGEDRERVDRRVRTMLATRGDDTWREEFRIVHPEDGLLWIAGLGRIKRDVNGAALRMTGINIDVTERRRAEFQLRLQQSAQSRLARVGALGELAAGIAHEINQPLMAARIYTQLTVEALTSETISPDDVRSTAEKAVAQIERAAEVVRRLREFIQFGRSSLVASDVSDIVQTSVAIMQPEVERAGVVVREDLHRSLPRVSADSLQIEQVILNLLRNSVEAMAEAGMANGSVTIEAKPAEAGFVEICVRDNGPGFPLEQPPGPPQPFMTTKADGLGFGLSLSRSIVEAHGGRLWIGGSRPGAAVHFTLAVAQEGRL